MYNLVINRLITSISKENLIKNSMNKFLGPLNLCLQSLVKVLRILIHLTKQEEYSRNNLIMLNININLLILGKFRLPKVRKSYQGP